MNNSEATLSISILNRMQDHLQANRWIIAFSGGIDSYVLLHAIVNLSKTHKLPTISAVHINHQLQQDANNWVKHCKIICAKLAVPLKVFTANITDTDIKIHGVEQAARISRYNLFEQELQPNDCLLQGHHKNDQAETILLRLFRGSGIDGLAGIPETRALGLGNLVRPMLTITKKQLEKYAMDFNLNFIDDPSNTNTDFSRNFIRHDILPKLEKRWQKLIDRLAATAKEAEIISNDILQETIANLQQCLPAKSFNLLDQYSVILINKLLEFNNSKQQRIIRLWLSNNGVLSPSRDMINKIIEEIIKANVAANPLIKIGCCTIRRYLNYLVLVQHLDPKVTDTINWDWYQQPQIKINSMLLTIVKSKTNNKLAINLPNKPIQIKFRDQIDLKSTFSIANRKGSKKLKKLLQEYHVPPWLRDRIPMLFDNNNMIAAPSLWVCNNYQGKYNLNYECIVSFIKNK